MSHLLHLFRIESIALYLCIFILVSCHHTPLANPAVTRKAEQISTQAKKQYSAHQFDEAARQYKLLLTTFGYTTEWMVAYWDSQIQDDPQNNELKQKIREEILAFSAKDAEHLAAEYQGAAWLLKDAELAKKIEEQLLQYYPNNETSEFIAKESLDDISIEKDDSIRLEKIRNFLRKFPVSTFLPDIVPLELISLGRSNRLSEMISRADYWTKMFPDHSKVYLSAASALLKFKTAPEKAKRFAEKALNLFEKELQQSTPEPASKKLPEVTTGWCDYALCHARALIACGEESSAEAMLDRMTQKCSSNDMGLKAAVEYFMGKICQNKNFTDEAVIHWIESVCLGAPRNAWVKESLEALETIDPALNPADGMDRIRSIANYNGLVLDDVTDEMGLSVYQNSRVAWGDVNNDGFDDILLDGRILLINQKGQGWMDINSQSQFPGTACGGLFADIDNDGDLDLLALSHGETVETGDQMYINRGDGLFDLQPDSGITDLYPSEGAGWGDYNRDGYVDLYVANYEKKVTEFQPERGMGSPDYLYRNEGNGHFTDVTKEMKIIPPYGRDLCGRGVSWCDYDKDGDQDIFVSNYRLQENFLWKNEGDCFQNVAIACGVAGNETDGYWGHTIGSDWGDFNQDGWMDLFSANLAHPRYIKFSNISQLLKNPGVPGAAFEDCISGSGITYDETHSDPTWADFDLDGDLDLYLTSIYPDERSYLYLQEQDGSFTDVTFLSGARVYNGWGNAVSDFDRDGDLDLLVGSGSGIRLFRNRGNDNHRLSIDLKSSFPDNASVIGTSVEITQAEATQYRQIQAGKGTTSQNSLRLCFGFGSNNESVGIRIITPRGRILEYTNVTPDRHLTIDCTGGTLFSEEITGGVMGWVEEKDIQ